jgi:hypothetical protein
LVKLHDTSGAGLGAPAPLPERLVKGCAAGVRHQSSNIAKMLQKNNKSVGSEGPSHHFACSDHPHFGRIAPSLLVKKGWRDMGYCW